CYGWLLTMEVHVHFRGALSHVQNMRRLYGKQSEVSRTPDPPATYCFSPGLTGDGCHFRFDQLLDEEPSLDGNGLLHDRRRDRDRPSGRGFRPRRLGFDSEEYAGEKRRINSRRR